MASTKQSSQINQRPQSDREHFRDDDDGYLEFVTRDPYETIDKDRIEDKSHYYSFIKPEKPSVHGASAQIITENNKTDFKTSIFSRKCLLVSIVVNVCTVAVTTIVVFYVMKASTEQCSEASVELLARNEIPVPMTSTSTVRSTSPSASKSLPTLSTKSMLDSVSTTSMFDSGTTTSLYDSDTTTSNLDFESLCKENEDLLVPHPNECQAFYNCSPYHSNGRPPYMFPQQYDECNYPDLFSEDSLSCEHFENVGCGTRVEAKSGCDYALLRCYGHCTPCSVYYPSCEGLDNGRNVRPDGYLWTPHYILCYKERFVGFNHCVRDNQGTPTFFNPFTKSCESLEHVPEGHGGYMPNCTGKSYGTYPFQGYKCDRYYICGDGEYIGFIVCPSGQEYDPFTNECTSQADLC